MRVTLTLAPALVVAALHVLAGCGLTAPALGTPCASGAACPPGYACDPASSICLPAQAPVDAGDADAGPIDAGPVDAGPEDAGPDDAGPTDAGPTDAGPTDAGPTDAGAVACDEYVGADRPPVAFGTTAVVTAGTPASLQLLATDPDPGALTYQLVSSNGVVADVTSGGLATVTSATDGSFVYRATGQGGACSEERVDVVVVDAASFDFRFVGAADADWSAPESWDPPGTPATGASVLIPAGATVDVDVSPTVDRLVVATGASLALGLRTITANVLMVGGDIGGNAPVKLIAMGGALGGKLVDVDVRSASTVSRPTTVHGALTISGGVLTASAPLAVTGNLTTVGPVGALAQPVDVRVHVELSATFDGARSELSAGTFSVRGGFRQNATVSYGSFAGSGDHTLILDGAARQLVYSYGGGAGDRANHVEVRGPAELTSNLVCAGDVHLRPGASFDGPFVVDPIGRLLVDFGATFSPSAFVIRNDFDVNGSYGVANTTVVTALQLPVGFALQNVLVYGPVSITADTEVQNISVGGGSALTVQDATLTVQNLRVEDLGVLAMSYGTSRVVVLGDAVMLPYTPELSLAAGTIAFRGDVVSLLNNLAGYTRGFGAPGHAWVFESGGTTVLTSNIVARGCELNRTVPCTIDDDCGAIALGSCLTGGVMLRDVSVADGTTLEVNDPLLVLGSLTVAAGATLLLHDTFELAEPDPPLAGTVICDAPTLSPTICPP